MRGKKYQQIKSKIDKSKIYTLDEAIDFIKTNHSAKFDETIEVHLKLGINASKTEQNIKGLVVLPHGGIKQKRIAAFVSPNKVEEAQEAGAAIVGGEDLIQKIKETNKCDFDIAVAEPEMMKNLAGIAKILGPKGLMPSPKTETVSTDIKKTITELSKGKVAFKNDQGGNVHLGVAKVSWEPTKIKENIKAFVDAVKKTKPSGLKGNFIKHIIVSSTMGPGLTVQL